MNALQAMWPPFNPPNSSSLGKFHVVFTNFNSWIPNVAALWSLHREKVACAKRRKLTRLGLFDFLCPIKVAPEQTHCKALCVVSHWVYEARPLGE